MQASVVSTSSLAVPLRRGLVFSELKSPLALCGFILAAGGAGFGISVRGLPFWFQLPILLAAICCFICFTFTITIDPGIIQPNSIDDPIVSTLDLSHRTAVDECYRYCMDGDRVLRLPVSCDEDIDLVLWEKYCGTCKIWRPPRAHHCRKCGYCMNRFDHHCSVLGTCIARNNHRFFSIFLLCAHFCSIMFAGGGVWRLKRFNFPAQPETWEDGEMYVVLVLIIVYCYICLLLVFGLGHCLSIIFDITTKDLLVDSQVWQNRPCCSRRRSPYALLKNFVWVCFAPVRTRYVRPINVDRSEMGYHRLRSSLNEDALV